MFQSSKKKAEMEREIVRQQQSLHTFSQAVVNIREYSDKALDFMDELEKEQTGFDNALTHVVEYIKQIRAGEEEQAAREAELLIRMAELASGLEKSEEGYQSFFQAVKEHQDELLKIVEQNKRFTDPARSLEQTAGDMEQDIEHMAEELDSMGDFGRQMEVLSLGAAIEAGRMGESGRKFVAAAEEVRSFAGKYQEAARDAASQVEKLKQRLRDAREQMEYMASLLKENNIHMGNTARMLQECTGHAEESSLSAESRSIWENMKAAAAVTEQHEAYFEQTLQSMELAGESFMREQQLKEQMKEQLKWVLQETEKVR